SCFTPSFETVSTRIRTGSKPTCTMASSTFFADGRKIPQAACLATVTVEPRAASCERVRHGWSGGADQPSHRGLVGHSAKHFRGSACRRDADLRRWPAELSSLSNG